MQQGNGNADRCWFQTIVINSFYHATAHSNLAAFIIIRTVLLFLFTESWLLWCPFDTQIFRLTRYFMIVTSNGIDIEPKEGGQAKILFSEDKSTGDEMMLSRPKIL